MSCISFAARFSGFRSGGRAIIFLLCMVAFEASAQMWVNSSPLTIPSVGTASLYPSKINVSGASGTITSVKVTLNGLNHTWPDDMDMLLVGPTGQSVILWSDVGGGTDIVNATIVLDGAAGVALPDNAAIVSGSYLPTNVGAGDAFASPAPSGPYAASLSAFIGTDPNGEWSLYILDDEASDQGSLANGWSLAISTTTPNTPPTISFIADQTINEDVATGVLNFTVGDLETAVGSLIVTATSSDVVLIPNANIALGGTGANRTIQMTPATNRFGNSTITLSVNDGFTTVTRTFVVTVLSVNDLPTITPFASLVTLPNVPTPSIPFTVGDVETAAANLTVSGSSSNPVLVPVANIVFSGTGAQRSLVITPATGQTGNATITVTVADANSGTSSQSFLIGVGTGFGPVIFPNSTPLTIPDSGKASVYPSIITVSGMSGTVSKLIVRVKGMNHTWPSDIDMLLVGPAGQKVMLMSDAGSSFDLVGVDLLFDDAAAAVLPSVAAITSGSYKPTDYGTTDAFPAPAPAAPYSTALFAFSGTVPNGDWALYVVDAFSGDGGSIASGWSLEVTTTVNSAPAIGSIADVTAAFGAAVPPVNYTIQDAESAPELLNVSVTSSKADLLPVANIALQGTGANRSLVLTPVVGVYGSSTVSVTVTDPQGLTASSSFIFTVQPPVGSLVKVVSSSWSLEVDGNHNGFFESGRLNWNVDATGGGTYTVFEKIYWRTNQSSWVLFATTDPYVVTGVGTGDARFLDIPEQATKVNSMHVDYQIEVFRLNQTVADDLRSPANDPGLSGHPEEGLPDLAIYAPSISPVLSTELFQANDCAVGHLCVGSGMRRILRFGTITRNVGTTDLYLGNPQTSSDFVFDTCHGHYHFQGFANYRLLAGNVLAAVGNKVGFCLEDVGRFDPQANPNPKYTCSNQGIQAGWYDFYNSALTCQWIDITGVPPGDYQLEVTVNPLFLLKESNYANNVALVPVTITNTLPTIGPLSDRSTIQNTPTASIPVVLWDAESDPANLVLTATSSNPALVPVPNIVFSGSGPNRTFVITPSQNTSGTASITIVVQDQHGGAASSTFTLTVGNSAAPVVTLASAVQTYVENAPGLPVDSAASVTDSDSADFSGGSVIVDIVSQPQAEDRLGVNHTGNGASQIGVNGATVSFGGVAIGTISGGDTGSSPLVIALSGAAATPQAVQALLRNIVYWDVSENPIVLPRTLRVVVSDGDGGVSAPATRDVVVGAVNDVPLVSLPSAPLTYTENNPPMVIDAAGVIQDVDSANFELGHLKVTLTQNGTADDRLVIQQGGQITLSGNFISYAGILIGTFGGGTDGSTPLLIDFDVIPTTVTVAVAQDIMRSIRYSNVSDLPGSQPRLATFEVADGDGGTTTAVQTINVLPTPDSPVITWPTPASIVYGTPLGAAQLNASANVPGTFSYSPGAGTILNAGLHQLLFVTFTPTDQVNYSVDTIGVQIDVQKATPSITWSNPADITLGTALGALQLNAIANVPGAFVYTPGSGTVLSAGSGQLLSTTFNPTDVANYVAATATVAINVINTTAPVVTLASTSQTYVEKAPPVVLDSAALVSDPDSVDFNGGSVTVDFVSPPQAEDRLAVSHTGNGAGEIGVNGTAVSYGGVNIGTAAGGETGSSPLVIALSGPAATPQAVQALLRNVVYSDVSNNPVVTPRTVRVVINDGSGGVSLPATRTIVLTAVNDVPIVNLPSGSLTYTENNPPMAIDSAASVQDVDSANFELGRLKVSLTQNGTVDDRLLIQPGGQITLAGNSISYGGTPIGTISGGTDGSTPLLVSFDVIPSTVTPSVAQDLMRNVRYFNVSDLPGSLPRQATFEVADGDGGVTTATQTINVVPTPDNPVITWVNPSPITYGTALGAGQLNATASVPGDFVYAPASGTVLNAGAAQVLTVTFTPTDLVNYQQVNATVQIDVLKASPTITWANPASITYGTSLGAAQLNATASVPGNFVYAPASGTALNAGAAQTLSTTFTPTDLANYQVVGKSVTLTVAPAPLIITAENKTRLAGTANPTFTALYSGFVNQDTSASLSPGVSLTTVATPASPAGTYPIVASGAANPNYSITHVNGVLTVTPASLVNSFTNSTSITIPALGAATVYPLVIPVSGLAGHITGVKVSLLGLNHTWPDDLDVLLVGPNNNSVLLMSDVGGSADLINLPLTFSDAASSSLPDNAQVVAGSYKPTNVGTGDTFSTPAPAGPYGTSLAVFNQLSPNGNWSLYIVDDEAGDQGSMTGGWSLEITTALDNALPTISDIVDQATTAGVPSASIPFTVGDLETPVANLVISGTSSDQALVPNGNLVFGGSGASRTLVVTPSAGVSGTSTITVSVSDGNGGVATDSFVLTVNSGLGPLTFARSTAFTIPDSGSASLYPSTITVAGMLGTVSKVVVQVSGVNHTWPDDIDCLLVGPGGQSVLLFSDVGGGADLVNVNLTFDQAASASLPDNAQIVSGTFKPTNFGTGADTFPAPAPAAPYGSALSVLTGSAPNGTWSLYVVDGFAGDAGSVTGGWSLTLTTQVPPPPPLPGLADVSGGELSISSVKPLPNGTIELTLTGQAGAGYVLEYSRNLRDWTVLRDDSLTADSTVVHDETSGGATARFYRLRPKQ